MVRAAVVGLGWWGRHIVERFASRETSNLKIVLAVEVSLDSAQDFSRKHKLELVGELSIATERSDIDAIILTTPHALHEEQVKLSAHAGKHVFCEKPLALTRVSAEQMVETCHNANVILGIGHERRFEPAMLAVKDLVDNGDLGTILHVEAAFSHNKLARLAADDWRASPEHGPAVAFTGMGVHLTDSWIQMFGIPDSVFAQRAQRVTRIPTGDVVCVQARFKSGMTGFLSALMVTPFYMRYHVFGSKGWAQVIDSTHPDDPDHSAQLSVRTECEKCWSEDFENADAVVANLECFADAVKGISEYPVSEEELVANVAVLEAISRSFESGRVEYV